MKTVFKKNSGKKIVFSLLTLLSFNSSTFAKATEQSISDSAYNLTSSLWGGIKSGGLYVYNNLPTLNPSKTLLLPCKDEIGNLRTLKNIIADGYKDYNSGTFTPGYIPQINKAILDLKFDKGLDHSGLIRALEDGNKCMTEYNENISETLQYMGTEKANGIYTNAGYGNDIIAAQESLNTDISNAVGKVNVGNIAKDGYIYSSDPVCPFHDSISQEGAQSELAVKYVKELSQLKEQGLHEFEQCMQKPVTKSALLAKAYKELAADKANIETQASKARWEHTKYYARKLLESFDELHPALKWTTVGTLGSLATYYVGYKLAYRNLIYRFYKWNKGKTPTLLNAEITKLIRDGQQNGNIAGANLTKLNQALEDLKNY